MALDKGQLVFDGKPEDALKADLEKWGIRNPLKDGDFRSLVWS